MGLAKSFNKSLHKNLAIYAAWFPVANTLRVGDYGLIERGVFTKMGNVSEYDVEMELEAGKSTSINYSSEGTTVIRFVGNAQVESFPETGDLDAKLSFNFQGENSCLIKADMSVIEMQNMNQVARKLAGIRNWDQRFRVVSASYTGDQCVIVAAKEANTEINFTGSVSLLKQVEGGKVEIEPGFSSTNKKIFKSVGKTGVVGLSLFKLDKQSRPQILRGEAQIDIKRDWGEELEDDL
jgi:hypothetical protein